MRKRLIGIVVVLVICGACAGIPMLLRSSGGANFGPPTKASLKTVTIDTGDLRSLVTATGSVVANRQSTLSFDQSGTVTTVLVTEGQHVDAGQTIAQLDDTTEKFNVQQAEFSVQAAQAALDKLLEPVNANDIADADANVKAAQASYSARAGAVSPAQIKASQLQADQAAAAAKAADYLRAGAGGQYTQDDPNYQKTVAQVGIAQTNAEIARLKLDQLKAGTSLESATANIGVAQAKAAQIKAGVKQIDIDDAQAQLAIAKVQLDQAKHRLDKTHLIAPFAGTITTLNAKAGEALAGAAATLTDDSQLYTDIQVDESDIGKVRVGQPVEMTLDALPGVNLSGTVQRIDQTADITTSVITYTVRVAFDKTDAPIKVNMTVNATFVIADVQNVVRIPNEFLKQNRATGQTTVNIVNADGTYTDTPIKIGIQGIDYTEVINGLRDGDNVALIIDSTKVGQ